MHKLNQHIYLIINGGLLFLLICVLYLLSPLFQSIFKLIFEAGSPFLYGFILASLIYPVVHPIRSKIIKMIVILFIYLGLVFMIVTSSLVTLPRLIKDFQFFLDFFQIEWSYFNQHMVSSIQISTKVIITIFNAIIISLFYLFDEPLLTKLYYRLPGHHLVLSRYYDFIEYFYALVCHILIRMGLTLLLMLAIKQPYGMIISLLGLISFIPILGNMIFYGVLCLCFIYYPIILIPLLLLILFDIYFFRQHPYNLLKMLVVFVALRLLNPYFVLFSLPVYFFVIAHKNSSYSVLREANHERYRLY